MSLQQNHTTYEIIQVPETTGIRFFTSVDPGSYIPAHWHRAIEILYLLEGELTVTVENHSQIYTAGQCVLINSSIIHATKCTTPNRAIVCQIPLDFMKLYIPEVEQILFILDETTENPVERTRLDRLKETLTQMQIANDICPKGFLLRFNSLLFELLYQLYHSFSVQVFQTEFTRKKKELDRLNPVLQYTAEHYNQAISLDEISEVAILQPGYFCRFFKKYMGTTFLEYQNELRLSHIYQDLLNTNDSIQQILERHGFTNYKLFRRMFHEHFGDTPSHIRQLHRT